MKNKYGGRCCKCGEWVEANQGLIKANPSIKGKTWLVYHENDSVCSYKIRNRAQLDHERSERRFFRELKNKRREADRLLERKLNPPPFSTMDWRDPNPGGWA
jgi:hypothetical protein